MNPTLKRILVTGGSAAFALGLLMGAAYVVPPGGSFTTTNNFVEGYYLATDGTNRYWAPVVATSTNALPSFVITNNQSTAHILIGNTTLGGSTVLSNSLRTAGGNARGATANDLQIGRDAVTKVASGNYSVIPGGSNNTAAGAFSFAGGESARAHGDYAFAYGKNATASNEYSFVGGGIDCFVGGFGAFSLGGNDNHVGLVPGAPIPSAQANVYSGIIGGAANTISNSIASTIFGGQDNVINGIHESGDHTTVGIYSSDGTIVAESHQTIAIGGLSHRMIRNTNGVSIGSRNTNYGYGATLIGNAITNNTDLVVRLGFGQKATSIASNGAVTVPGDLSANDTTINSLDVTTDANVNGTMGATAVQALHISPVLTTASRGAMIGPDGILTNLPAGSAGQFLRQDLTWAAAGGGPGTPGGDTAAVQFNQDTALDGTNRFTYDRTNEYLRLRYPSAGGGIELIQDTTGITNRFGASTVGVSGTTLHFTAGGFESTHRQWAMSSGGYLEPNVNNTTRGVGSPGNEARFYSLSTSNKNFKEQTPTNITATTASLDWNGPSFVRYAPAGTFTLSFVNTPSAGTATRQIYMELLTEQSGSFPAGIDWGPDGAFIASGVTNFYIFEWNGTNVTGWSRYGPSTGTGAGVLSNAPSITGLKLVDLDTNALLWINPAWQVKTAAVSGATFDNGTLTVTAGGTREGLQLSQYSNHVMIARPWQWFVTSASTPTAFGSMHSPALSGSLAGLFRIATATVPSHTLYQSTDAGNVNFGLDQNGSSMTTATNFYWWTKVALTNISDVRCQIGFGTSMTSDALANHTAVLRYSTAVGDDSWVLQTSDGSTVKTNDTGVAVTADTIYNLAILRTNDVVVAYINGSPIVSNVVNIPTGFSTAHDFQVHARSLTTITNALKFFGAGGWNKE